MTPEQALRMSEMLDRMAPYVIPGEGQLTNATSVSPQGVAVFVTIEDDGNSPERHRVIWTIPGDDQVAQAEYVAYDDARKFYLDLVKLHTPEAAKLAA